MNRPPAISAHTTLDRDVKNCTADGARGREQSANQAIRGETHNRHAPAVAKRVPAGESLVAEKAADEGQE